MSTEISSDLFLAILSMDSYNRGYDAGIVLNGSAIGNAIIETDSEEVFYEEGQAPGALSSAAAVGFYASAYTLTADVDTLSAGTIVISYRGTDNYAELDGNDVLNGWITGAGATSGQIEFAGQFYNAVKAANPTANIVFTGHSLGGALAGFTAEVTGASGAIATAA